MTATCISFSIQKFGYTFHQSIDLSLGNENKRIEIRNKPPIGYNLQSPIHSRKLCQAFHI